jgi:hypothetical protein
LNHAISTSNTPISVKIKSHPPTTTRDDEGATLKIMFLPGAEVEAKKAEEDRKAAFKNIETWALELMPAEVRDDANVSSQEVMCGDPECAPIDTAVTIQFAR